MGDTKAMKIEQFKLTDLDQVTGGMNGIAATSALTSSTPVADSSMS